MTGLASLPANLTVLPAAAAPETYTVAKGDSLWKIAKTVYGKGTMWKVIYEANKATVKDPNMIIVGQSLILPAA